MVIALVGYIFGGNFFGRYIFGGYIIRVIFYIIFE